MDQFALASIGQFAVGTAELDLRIAFSAPNRTVTATTRKGQGLGLASELN